MLGHIYHITMLTVSFLFDFRLPVVSDCPAGQTARVTSNLHSSSSTMAVSRVPSPPLPEVNTPVAENWCYTQVSFHFPFIRLHIMRIRLCLAYLPGIRRFKTCENRNFKVAIYINISFRLHERYTFLCVIIPLTWH